MYVATLEYWPGPLCIESKSLKLYLNGFRDQGHFAEALAVKIRDDAAEALQLPADKVRVTLRQKSRGGITITAPDLALCASRSSRGSTSGSSSWRRSGRTRSSTFP